MLSHTVHYSRNVNIHVGDDTSKYCRMYLVEVLQKVAIDGHYSLSVVTHAPFHASVLRPASQVGPMHETAGTGKLVNAALLSLINEVCM